MPKNIPNQQVVDLTVDVGSLKTPLELKLGPTTREKLLNANDKFFNMFEECLFLMIVNVQDRVVVHCLTNYGDDDRMMAQYGWVLAYFQDCQYGD